MNVALMDRLLNPDLADKPFVKAVHFILNLLS
jgi:hypothetical protein